MRIIAIFPAEEEQFPVRICHQPCYIGGMNDELRKLMRGINRAIVCECIGVLLATLFIFALLYFIACL